MYSIWDYSYCSCALQAFACITDSCVACIIESLNQSYPWLIDSIVVLGTIYIVTSFLGTVPACPYQPHNLLLLSLLSVIKARFSCILVNFTCRFEDSPSVPERSYKQSVDIFGYYYASISHVSTIHPLNFYTLSIDNSFMKVLKNAKSEMPTMFHSILPSKLPMGRMLL